MKTKFMFFNIKQNFIVNILIVIQIALWLFYSASLSSLINFDSSYKSRFNKSISIDNAELMKFYKIIQNDDYFENTESYNNTIKDILNLIRSYNYNYGFVQECVDKNIPIESLGFNSKDLESNFTAGADLSSSATPIGFNYGMIENYKKNIIGEISEDNWVKSNDFIPVIIGSEISKKVNIGDNFSSDGITYKVIGTFRKDTLTFNYTDSVNSSFLLNNSFVIPLNDDEFFENFGFQPITIFFNGDKEQASPELNSAIDQISKDIVLSDFHDDLNQFLQELNSQKYYEIFRIIIITLLASASIITTINYKINESKDKIGILFSFGISKKNIFKMFSSEFLIYIFIGIISGSLFYLKNCKHVYSFFINENLLFNLYISIFILLAIIISILFMGFNMINKLTPKEMIGGFIE